MLAMLPAPISRVQPGMPSNLPFGTLQRRPQGRQPADISITGLKHGNCRLNIDLTEHLLMSD